MMQNKYAYRKEIYVTTNSAIDIINYKIIFIMLKDCPLFDSKVSSKRIINLYYAALMTYLVFTFADDLLQGLVTDFRIEYVLYAIFWLALVIQTTFAYIHIMNIKKEKYTSLVLASDCLDIVITIFVCVMISNTYKDGVYRELPDYRYLSIPFIVLAINQTCWYASIEEHNSPAMARLIILFVGMLAVTISESICHNIWNLAIFVIVHALSMAILRAFDASKQESTDLEKE